jgi:superfamily I DNA/RNA helicase
LALLLFVAGRGVSIVGSDVGPGLVKVLKKLGPESMRQFQVMDAIDDWEEARGTKAKSKESVADRAECLRVFAEHGDTLSAAVAYAEHLFKSQGTIQLLSGHKSKGLEWNTVYHLDPWRIPSKYAQGRRPSNKSQTLTTSSQRGPSENSGS